MALDNKNKRSSAINASSPWRSRLPFPNGGISAQDRAHAAYMLYLAAGGAAGDDLVANYIPIFRPRRRY